jgi:3-deoxy-manno-octulosonate cytidylyltransferase (CMP-KDO synthetase)
LLRLASLATGGLEEAEKLEQLRALDNGIGIQVWETRHASLRIDTPADILSAIESLRRLALNKPLETSTRL